MTSDLSVRSFHLRCYTILELNALQETSNYQTLNQHLSSSYKQQGNINQINMLMNLNNKIICELNFIHFIYCSSCLIHMKVAVIFLVTNIVALSEGSLIRTNNLNSASKSFNINSIYAFGEYESFEKLSVRSEKSPGFIELSFDGNRLAIERVRRPSEWSTNSKFCTRFLPAAVSDFIHTKINIPIEDIGNIFVRNMAVPREAGCRCYVGLMLKMGFNIINDRVLTDPYRYCNIFGSHSSYITGKPGDKGVHHPYVDTMAYLIVKLSFSYSKIRSTGV